MSDGVRFQSTLWSRIRLVRQADAGAVTDFVERYREPVLRFIRNAGFAEPDAEELAQDVFARLLADDVLAKADQAKGKFRSFLLGITRNVMREERRRRSADKRGGGRDVLSLDDDRIAEPPAAEPPDEDFDRAWVAQLLASALRALEEEHPLQHRILRACVHEGRAYQDVADELGRRLQDVKNHVHRARRKLTELLQREVARYASSGEEYEEEVRYLARFLSPRGQ
ncbi:MAG TPA: RNA polymerase sigma factor [Planctomycetota bacterium]|nr:RNA polymerase sigma factor [Planctomycetota bacterium]